MRNQQQQEAAGVWRRRRSSSTHKAPSPTAAAGTLGDRLSAMPGTNLTRRRSSQMPPGMRRQLSRRVPGRRCSTTTRRMSIRPSISHQLVALPPTTVVMQQATALQSHRQSFDADCCSATVPSTPNCSTPSSANCAPSSPNCAPSSPNCAPSSPNCASSSPNCAPSSPTQLTGQNNIYVIFLLYL